jgi:hypothetical protein
MNNYPKDRRDERTGFSTTALVVALLAAALLLGLFTLGDWTTAPTRDTAMNNNTTTQQTIPQQGTEQPAQPSQPAQPEQPPPPAGGNTTQP